MNLIRLLLSLAAAVGFVGQLKAAPHTTGAFQLSITGTHLTLRAHAVPLGNVMDALEKESEVRVDVEEAVAGDLIWVDLEDHPLTEGVKQLLKRHNHILYYEEASSGQQDRAPSKLVGISVYARSSIEEDFDTEPEGSRETAIAESTPSQMPMTHDPWVSVQQTTVDSLWDLVDEDPMQIQNALSLTARDANPEIRQSALELAEGFGLDEAVQAKSVQHIGEMALYDPDPELRMEALNLLLDFDPSLALTYVEQAVLDRNPDVQALASEVYEDLTNPSP